ncbi:PP2C family protein-serine/threonine phosphatase [Streptomyces sp. NPDC047974]|uniref:PP2C family protein-serine/threonine phosphatase n=1 Tax=Streptomyces sp. NPDC047974 TaxID=3154343 RepID=UPI0033C250E5
MPWAVWSTAVVIAFTTDRELSAGPLLAALPAIAAICHRWPGILGFGVLALTTQTALRWGMHPLGRTGFPMVTASIVLVTATCLAAALARERGERTVNHLRDLARGVQEAILRPLPRTLCGYRLSALYRAADTEALVGGDFYEAITTPWGLRIAVGDVAGKGLPAVDATVTLLGAFREAACAERDLGAVAHRMDASLRRRQQSTGDDRHATVLLIEAGTHGDCAFVNCGHVLPILMSDGTATEIPLPPGLPLGMLDLDGSSRPATFRHPFPPKSRIVVVSDGVTEARDATGTFYDLAKALPLLNGYSTTGLTHAVLRLLTHHTSGTLQDDTTIVAITRQATNRPQPSPFAAVGTVDRSV